MVQSEPKPIFLQEMQNSIALDDVWKNQLQRCEQQQQIDYYLTSKDNFQYWNEWFFILSNLI